MKAFSKTKAGFTLVEVMVAVTISAFILTSAYATIISLAKGSESMINYSEMNGQTRVALEVFGRDARMAKNVSEFTTTKFTMLREVFNPATNKYEDHFVTYQYIATAGTFTRDEYTSYTGANGKTVPNKLVSSDILLFDVEDINFFYYRLVDLDASGYDPIAKTVLEVKHVQLEAKLERPVLNLTNTNYIISARFMMRNKDVGE